MNPRLEAARKKMVQDNARQVQEEKSEVVTEEVKAPEVKEEKVIEDKVIESVQETKAVQQPEINDELVFKYLSEKLGREINDYDNLTKVEERIVEKEVEVLKEIELDPEVKAFSDYKKDTNRGILDFARSQDDWSGRSDNEKAREYLRSKHSRLTESQIDSMIKRKYKPDPEVATEEEVEQAEIDFAILLEEADTFLADRQSKYKVPKQVEKKEVANTQSQDELKAWMLGVDNAGKNISDVDIDGFKYDLKNIDISKYSTPDAFMQQFVGEDKNVNFKELIETLEIGRAVKNGSFTKAFSDSLQTKWLEEQHKEMNNHKEKKEVHDTEKKPDIDVDATTAYMNNYLQMLRNKKR